LDKSGNVYVTGETGNPLFPTTSNAYPPACPYTPNSITGCSADFFVEVNPSLSGASALAYSSFFVGAGTAGISSAGIAVDSGGLVYLTGTGGSITSNGWGFVAKFDLTAGTNGLDYMNYWPSNSAFPAYLTFTAAGGLYVVGLVEDAYGVTTLGAYQTTFLGTGYYNAFVCQLAPATGNVLFGTLVGSAAAGGATVGTSVATDAACPGSTSKRNGWAGIDTLGWLEGAAKAATAAVK
jgi:hypothetical protein